MDITYYKKYEPIFGSWKIVSEIGEGSYGKVFEIEREDFGRTYKAALKAITIPQSQSEIKSAMADGMDKESATTYFRGFVEDMVDEFALMSKLKGNSNIVSYEDHVVVQHTKDIGWDILIRMELLTPLVDYVQRHTLSYDETIKLGIDMCKALEACRHCNIIHRDIKPENIFISALGDFKLGDFGIAKTVEKTMGGLSKKGTYTYMAPEVYKGDAYGPSVDIYSLGIVLYRYLNDNRTPFLSRDTVPTYKEKEKAITRRIGGEDIPAPANADEDLAKVILKACAYKPADRYSSPSEMREDLEAIAAGAAPVHAKGFVPPIKDTPASEEPTVPEIGGKTPPKGDDPEDFNKTASVFGGIKIDPVKPPKPEKPPVKKPKEKPHKPPKKAKEKGKKTPAIIAAGLLLAIVVGIFASGNFGKPAHQDDWTDWLEELPNGVSEDDFEIEELTKYRSRNKETTSSTDSNKMEGWTLEETADKGDFGAWSDWSTTAVSGSATREVESETRYRSRNLETSTGSSSSKSGWELANTTYAWGNYGSWSPWQTSSVSSSDSRKVETKTQYSYRTKSTSQQYSSWGGWSSWQNSSVSANDLRDVQSATFYRYYYYYCPYCGGHEPFTGKSDCGQMIPTNGSTWNETWSTIPYSQSNYHSFNYTSRKYYTESIGDGQRWCFSSGNLYDTAPGTIDADASSAVIKTMYRYRTRSVENVTNYSDWSSYSDTYQSSSSTKEVRTRTMYRYCDRSQVPTYHFQRWGSWSSWTPNHIAASATKQVESSTFYRHRDKVDKQTYIFYRWTDWSDWSETPIPKTDGNEVETQIMYRYKSK